MGRAIQIICFYGTPRMSGGCNLEADGLRNRY